MRLTITHKLTITILIFIVCSIGIIFLVIVPSLRSITEVSNAMSKHVQSENDEFERIRLLRRSLTEIGTIKKSLDTVTSIAATKHEEEELIEEVEAIAYKHGVDQVLSVSYRAHTDTSEFPGYYLFSFTAAGLLEQVRAYFAELEKLPFYLDIRRVTIEKSPKLGENMVTISFSAALNSSSEL